MPAENLVLLADAWFPQREGDDPTHYLHAVHVLSQLRQAEALEMIAQHLAKLVDNTSETPDLDPIARSLSHIGRLLEQAPLGR